jgi:hypothetical protein
MLMKGFEDAVSLQGLMSGTVFLFPEFYSSTE